MSLIKCMPTMLFFIILLLFWGNHSSAADNKGEGGLFASRQRCVEQINVLRASIGIRPLGSWDTASDCADQAAELEALAGPVHGSFGSCGELGQNLCSGYNSIDQVLEVCFKIMWEEGPGVSFQDHGHYLNMANKNYSMVACGFFTDSQGNVYHVQNFR